MTPRINVHAVGLRYVLVVFGLFEEEEQLQMRGALPLLIGPYIVL